MIKKGLCVVMTLLLAAGILAGCGKKEATENISVITVSQDEGYATNMTKDAAERYATENKLIYQAHYVTDGKQESIEAEIEKAAAAGTDIVLCHGAAFEIPLFQMQSKYKNIKFVMVDGVPRKSEGKKYKIRKNTRSILYGEEQGGFLAGYTAVKEGYMKLGFMGGIPDESVMRYGVGFVQGANYAAKEMKLSKDKIVVRFSYLGTNEMSPALMEMAGQWYDDGCEVILAAGGSIGTAVMKAAEQKDKKVIGVDRDQSKESTSVITSVVKDINSSVYATIDSVYKKEFKGKIADVLDIASGGIALSMDTSDLKTFTQKDYSLIVTKITDGNLEILTQDIDKIVAQGGVIENITLNIE